MCRLADPLSRSRASIAGAAVAALRYRRRWTRGATPSSSVAGPTGPLRKASGGAALVDAGTAEVLQTAPLARKRVTLATPPSGVGNARAAAGDDVFP